MISKIGILFVLCTALFATTGSGQVTLNVLDGEIGGDITFEFEGPPNSVYLNLMSLGEGPTCFPPPHISECVPLGLDLFKLSFQIPGFFGNLGPTGQKSMTFPIPDNPNLDGIVLRDMLFQVTDGALSHTSELQKITFAYPGTFALSLGEMFIAHFGCPTVTMPDGRVLLAGGSDVPSHHVEAYNPRCEDFENLAFMPLGVVAHTVTLLQDGTVLSVGGADFASNSAERVAQIYDPATNTWAFTTGQPVTRRALHQASLLPDGRVLISGGTTDISDLVTAALSALDTTEIYDPATGTFSAGPTMNDPRVAHSSTTLDNGQVLITGGLSYFTIIIKIPSLLSTAQRFNPNNDSLTGDIGMNGARAAHTTVKLDDGRVLLAGGVGGSVVSPLFLPTLDLSNSGGTSFTNSGSSMQTGRAYPAVIQLRDGNVLLAGGERGDIANSNPVKDADIFDPALDQCTATNDMNVPRTIATAVLLPDGSAAVFGGSFDTNRADIYHD